MDEISKKILNLLRQDSRLTVRELALRTGAHRNTVSKKLESLEKNSIIEKYTIIMKNSEKVDFQTRIMLIKLSSISRRITSQVESILSNDVSVSSYYKTTGQWSYVCFIENGSDDSFRNFLERIGQVDSIYAETLVVI